MCVKKNTFQEIYTENKSLGVFINHDSKYQLAACEEKVLL